MMISHSEFLERTSVNGATLDFWLDEEWIIPESSLQEPYFSDADVARAQLILSLSGQLGVNDEGTGIILHLLDQIHSLRNAVGASLNNSEASSADNSTL